MSGTLGYHRQMAVAFFGEESPAVAYLDQKITESPMGADEPVIADESQVVHLLVSIHLNGLGETRDETERRESDD